MTVPIQQALQLPAKALWVECRTILIREGVYEVPYTTDEGEQSQGPILFNFSQLHTNIGDYRSLPVVVDHPSDVERRNYPGTQRFLWEEPVKPEHVGYLLGTKRTRTTIQSRALIDIRKLHELAPHVAENLWGGRAIETSMGSRCNWDETTGEHAGQSFQFVANELIPDHLAILSSGEGAWGLRNGCGLVRNFKRTNYRGRNDGYLEQVRQGGKQ